MKITFLLPGRGVLPTGGFKVVLEYANKMANDNHHVTIVYPIGLRLDEVNNMGSVGKMQLYKKVITKTLKRQYSSRSWFPLDKRVNEKLVPYLGQKFIPDSDVIFATAWETAEWLYSYSMPLVRKLYLIQHFEDWYGDKKEAVDATWKLPLEKIVIARWLKEYADALGETTSLVRNGLNFKDYYIERPITERSKYHVSMLYHDMEIKGSIYGLQALELVKHAIPELKVTLFSTYRKPASIPGWMNYCYVPDNLREIYNQSAIFISSSIEEGWGLPRAEAMQCGCAVILTAVGGHLDYGSNGFDCIFTPVRDVKAMAQAIIDLIRDDEKRIGIAQEGNKTVQQFTWEKAYSQVKDIICNPTTS